MTIIKMLSINFISAAFLCNQFFSFSCKILIPAVAPFLGDPAFLAAACAQLAHIIGHAAIH